ncbi:unnamed protein product [Dovyalis caffra]|uniref:Uncharacterized protein n=1 Tax=Dovyalis caffra TaxID=77055 RepID=A0AAV1R6T3_9ROSI|nr:unnamed protein product [Dovyalis caffra]
MWLMSPKGYGGKTHELCMHDFGTSTCLNYRIQVMESLGQSFLVIRDQNGTNGCCIVASARFVIESLRLKVTVPNSTDLIGKPAKFEKIMLICYSSQSDVVTCHGMNCTKRFPLGGFLCNMPSQFVSFPFFPLNSCRKKMQSFDGNDESKYASNVMESLGQSFWVIMDQNVTNDCCIVASARSVIESLWLKVTGCTYDDMIQLLGFDYHLGEISDKLSEGFLLVFVFEVKIGHEKGVFNQPLSGICITGLHEWSRHAIADVLMYESCVFLSVFYFRLSVIGMLVAFVKGDL